MARTDQAQSKVAARAPRELVLRNRQRRLRLNLPRLRRVTTRLLDRELQLPAYSLGVTFVSPAVMARLNWTYLRHAGPTDVITFDHRDAPAAPLHGELFLCPGVAAAQAAELGVPWPEELVRYLVHGVLHLLGHDDHAPAARRRMKREENRLVRALAREFDLRARAGATSLPA